MKTKLMLFSSLVALLAATSAFAGGAWATVTITEISAYTSEGQSPNGMIYLVLSSNGTGNASCATTKNEVAIDTTTNAGYLAASLATAARLSGLTVNLAGAGNCGLESGIETLADIAL